ncbi:MAG: COR domain-containing protein [Chitinophagales bacterium]
MQIQEKAIRRITACSDNQLTTLDISNCGLTTIPDEVFELTHLTHLKLGHWSDHIKQSRNVITNISADIARLTQLTTLDLGSNEIQELPDALTELAHLESLDLSNNSLTALPSQVTQLSGLKILDLRSNKLKQLPESIGLLSKLERLGLRGNQLRKLPDAIREFKQLELLDLSGNQIEELADELAQLNQLKRLYLRNNRLKQLPRGIARLRNLQRLYLTSNQLKELPQNFDLLDNLQLLDLKNNEFSIISPELLNLSKLEYLDFSHNNLQVLPSDISKLQALEYLDLANNQLRVIPKSIAQIQVLQYLDLKHNALSRIPNKVPHMPHLQHLHLRDNPIEMPPPEIANRGIAAVRNYFKEIEKASEKIPLNEIKLLVVGEGRVGKSSLTKSLTQPNYKLEDEESTEGIAVQSWTIPSDEKNLFEEFRVNLWDFGGQEIYHATHQFFLTKRSIYLLVTESRREDKHEDFYYWLNIIKILGDKSPVIMVLNKIDQPTKELPVKEYRRVFDNIVNFQRVSCAPDYKHTISQLRNEIKQLLSNSNLLPHLGTPLPKVWVDIRKALEELKRRGYNYISYQEFLRICEKRHQDEASALFLSEFLHDLGVILHFKDDEELKHIVFLDHDWVTKGVYSILDNQVIKNQKGRFTDRDLSHIWKNQTFRDRGAELLSLMKNQKFEICFELNDGRYLAPQLLPVDEVDYEWRTDNDNLHFEYQYQFMPKGILTRLMVKRHPEIYEDTNWRYGTLLERNDTRALVRERYFDRKISIQVEGPDRENYLNRIRATIAEINSEFSNLEVTERLQCSCEVCRYAKEPNFYSYDLLLQYQAEGEDFIKCSAEYLKNVSVIELLRQVEMIDVSEKDEFAIDLLESELTNTLIPLDDFGERTTETSEAEQDETATPEFESVDTTNTSIEEEHSTSSSIDTSDHTVDEIDLTINPIGEEEQEAQTALEEIETANEQLTDKIEHPIETETEETLSTTTNGASQQPLTYTWIYVFLIVVMLLLTTFNLVWHYTDWLR